MIKHHHGFGPFWLTVLATAATSAATSVATAADVATQGTVTLTGARRVVAAALQYAASHGAPGAAIAVVDAGGQLVELERLDGTFAAGSDISVGKARTAVLFKRPTRQIEETINKGRDAMIPVAAVTWFTPLQGGIPISVGGQIVGAVGVSGAASAQQDEEIALAGAAALQTPVVDPAVAHVAVGEVNAAFSKGATGATLVESPAYRVNASRRDSAGEAELHVTDTDVFYVLEGRATVVTGGELVDARASASGEQRGTAIKGGTELTLNRGDVLTIPSGVPHWFKRVHTPFRYYVVKVTNGR
jgi:glc operon protein GlcG